MRVLRVALYPDHSRSAWRRVFNYLSFAASASLASLMVARPDVVYAYHPPGSAVLPALVMRRLRGVPFVLDVQDLWPETLPASGMLNSPRLLRMVQRWMDHVYRRADRSSSFPRASATPSRGAASTREDPASSQLDLRGADRRRRGAQRQTRRSQRTGSTSSLPARWAGSGARYPARRGGACYWRASRAPASSWSGAASRGGRALADRAREMKLGQCRLSRPATPAGSALCSPAPTHCSSTSRTIRSSPSPSPRKSRPYLRAGRPDPGGRYRRCCRPRRDGTGRPFLRPRRSGGDGGGSRGG